LESKQTFKCNLLDTWPKSSSVYLCIISEKMWMQAAFLNKTNKIGGVEHKQDQF